MTSIRAGLLSGPGNFRSYLIYPHSACLELRLESIIDGETLLALMIIHCKALLGGYLLRKTLKVVR